MRTTKDSIGELKQRAEADLQTHHSVREMKQSHGHYSEVEWVNTESIRTASGSDRAHANSFSMDSHEWEKNIHVIMTAPAVPAAYTIPTISGSDTPQAACTDNTWTATSTTNAPPDRTGHAAVWTGSEMIVWGGTNLQGVLNTGGKYKPSTDSWTDTSTSNAPVARLFHSGVWTGTEMIVWGGLDRVAKDLNTGGRYNPGTNGWTATSTSNAPSVRDLHTAVWTGTEMIVWGGEDDLGNGLNTGGKYNPTNDSWIATTNTNAPAARVAHSAIWTNTEMVVWGGNNGSTFLNTGGRYNPGANSWTATSTTNAPTGRNTHTAVWSGAEMFVWGGADNSSVFNTGGRYTPGTDSWTATNTVNAPAARDLHTAVWTGSEMIVWGGGDRVITGNDFNTGGRYNPGTNSWTATTTTNAPLARDSQTVVWTGAEMIVWGGDQNFNLNNPLKTGGRYCAQTGATPTPTPTPTATPTATPTPTSTPTPTPTPTPSPTPTPTPSPTPTPTPTATPTPTPTPTPTATPTPTPASSVQFSSSTYAVNEGGGKVDVTVTRSGSTSGTASMNYATSDTAGVVNCNVANGVASAKCDYISAFGTLKFAAGETSKTVSILIINDSYLEGPETFSVNLSNASGASLGSQATATVTINDNDTSTSANPIDLAAFFVTEHYYDFLNRTPDADGLAFWTNEITSCGTDQTCIGLKRINVSAAYFLSIEFQQTGYLVERIYKTAFGSASGASTLGGAHQLPVPIVRFNEFLADTQQIGQGVVVNVGNWQQQLESNKQAFALEFVQRSRFTSAFATTLTPAQFVDQLFNNAGVTPSTGDRNAAIAEFGSATNTSDTAARGRALRDVAENSILNTQEFNRAFVLMQFFGYLRRNPNDPQDIDYTGYEFWLNKLNQFNGNFVAAEMVKAFITSTEYRQRFGP